MQGQPANVYCDPVTGAVYVTEDPNDTTPLPAGAVIARNFRISEKGLFLIADEGQGTGGGGTPVDPGDPGNPGTFLQPFAANSFWNTKLNENTLFSSSSDPVVLSMRRGRRLFNNSAEDGSLNINTNGNWNVHMYQAKASDPLRTFDCAAVWAPPNYGGFTYQVTIRCPANATPSPDTDGMLVIFDPDGQRIHEFQMGDFGMNTNPWRARTYTCWDISGAAEGGQDPALGSGSINPDAGVIAMSIPGTPGRASGLPMAAGLLRLEHFQAGRIPQTLSMTVGGNDMTSPFQWPATRNDWWQNYPNNSEPGRVQGLGDGYVQCGHLFGIPPGVDLPALALANGWTDATLIVAIALQEYGVVVVDRSGSGGLQVDGSKPMAEWNALLTSTTKGQIKGDLVPLLRRITNNTKANPKGAN